MRPSSVAFISIALFVAASPHETDAATYPHFWSQGYGDGGNQSVNGVTTTAGGDIIVIGTFTGTVNFGGSDLTSLGGNDVFLARFTATGGHVWSQRFGDVGSQEGRSVAVGPNGNIVITGHFEGVLTLLPYVLVSAGGTDIYLAIISPDGLCLWASRFGDASFQYSTPLAIGPTGEIVIASAFLNSVNFGGLTLTSAGNYDIYVARFNNNGVHQWSYRFGDANWQDAACVAIDANSNVYVGGHFNGTFSFGGPNVSGTTDVYVVKLASTGAWLWSKDFGDNSGQYCNSLALDKSANVFITGYLDGTINFGGSDLTGVGDCFLAKFNTTGTHQWSKRFGLDANPQDGRVLATDDGGNVILGGHFSGQMDFGGEVLASTGGIDLFLAKLSGAGDHIWSRRFLGASNQQNPCMTMDFDDSIVYAGSFEGTVDFGGGFLFSTGATDAFVAKLGGDTFEPKITSILDIGNDQGHKVKVRFVRSGADAVLWPTPIIRYDAFRRDDPAPSSIPDLPLASARELLIDGWTQVGSVNAFTDNTYGIDVPTIGDSTIANGPYNSTFLIRAATAAPGTFYDSPPDSGYSLDNLAPGVPSSLMYISGVLVWGGSNAEDFDYFSVYGGYTSSFAEATLIDYTVNPSLNVSSSPYAHYFVTATDFSGNESAPALNMTPTDVGGSPQSYVLSISSYPNPFNPQTTIRYTLPSKSRVKVSIFDLRGALVATLVDEEKDKGAYTETWNGANAAGQRVSSGVYFAQITHANVSRTYKLVLLK